MMRERPASLTQPANSAARLLGGGALVQIMLFDVSGRGAVLDWPSA